MTVKQSKIGFRTKTLKQKLLRLTIRVDLDQVDQFSIAES